MDFDTEDKAYFGEYGNLWTPVGMGGVSSLYGGKPSDRVLLASYEENSIVNRLVNKNGNAVAQAACDGLRIVIKKNGSTEEVEDHPAINIFETVNETFNGYDLWHLTSRFLDVLGYCYWVKRRAGEVIVGIDVPSPISINPKRDDKGVVIGYEQTKKAGQQPEPIRKEDVVAFRNHALTDPYCKADSPVAAAFKEVTLSSAWAEYQIRLIKNRARPDWLLIPQAEGMGEDERKRQEAKLWERIGRNNNGKPLVADSFFKVVPLSFPPTDLAPLEINKEVAKAVCNALGMPPALEDKDANYANMEASLRLWSMQSVAPKLKKIEDVLNADFMPEFEDGAEICFENVIPADSASELKKKELEDKNLALILQSSPETLTHNELRERAGLPPVAGGDSPIAIQSAPDDKQEPTPPPQQEPPAPAKAFDPTALLKINAAVSAGELDRAAAVALAALTLAVPEEHAKRLVTHRAKKRKKAKTAAISAVCGCGKCGADATEQKKLTPAEAEKKLAAVCKDIFREQRRAVLSQLSGSKSLDPLDGIRSALGVKALPEKFVSLSKWDDDLDRRSMPLIEIMASDASKRTLTRIGASADVFSVMPAKLEEASKRASLRFAKSTNDTTSQKLEDALKQLREQLREGLSEGDTVAQLSKRVNEIFDNAETDRADLIAQTESMRSIHRGQQLAAQESGIVKGFKLLVSGDACDLCQEYADKEIGLDGKFNEADEYDDSPLPIHPGCRCTMLEILNEDEGEDNESDSE